jgi:succinate dehydrogenase hydrophobic anchor subunit
MLYKLNRFLFNVHKLDGLIHWIVQRSTAMTVLLLLFLVLSLDSLIIFFALGSLLIFHISVGIQTLIDDYMHDHVLSLISVTYLRTTVLFLFKILCVICI